MRCNRHHTHTGRYWNDFTPFQHLLRPVSFWRHHCSWSTYVAWNGKIVLFFFSEICGICGYWPQETEQGSWFNDFELWRSHNSTSFLVITWCAPVTRRHSLAHRRAHNQANNDEFCGGMAWEEAGGGDERGDKVIMVQNKWQEHVGRRLRLVNSLSTEMASPARLTHVVIVRARWGFELLTSAQCAHHSLRCDSLAWRSLFSEANFRLTVFNSQLMTTFVTHKLLTRRLCGLYVK